MKGLNSQYLQERQNQLLGSPKSILIGGESYEVSIGENFEMNVLDKKLVLTSDQLEATGGELEISARMMSSLVLSKSMTGDDFGQHILWCAMISKHNVTEHLVWRSPSIYPIMMQIFGLYPLNPSCVGFEVMLLLQQPLADTGATLGQYILQVVKQLNAMDCEQQYSDFQIKNITPAYEKILNQIGALLEQTGFMEKIEALEQKRLSEFKAKTLQEQELDQNPQEKKLVQQEPPQYRPTYDPRNSEKKVNTSGEIGFLGYFSGPMTGYMKEYSMHTFGEDLRWTVDDKIHKILDPSTMMSSGELVYTTQLRQGTNALPIPKGMKVIGSKPQVQLYQNISGDWFADSNSSGSIDIMMVKSSSGKDAYLHTTQLFTPQGTLKEFLDQIKVFTPLDQLQRIADHIKNKYYDTKYQGSLVENANNADEYAQLLWNASKMECYSANTLLVMMARQLGFEARLACGFNSKTVHENKAYITSNDGHARAEVKLNGKWIIMDVTPVHQENEMQDLQDQDIKKDPFGAKLTPSQLQALKEQQLKNSKDLSREIQQLLKQGVALATALKFQQLIEKTKKKSEYIADELIKMLQDTYEIQTSKTIHTIKATSQIDLTKLLRTVPAIFNDNPEEKIHDLNQLKKTPLYKKEIQESHEITKLPDELRTHLMIDVSGSMESYTTKTSESLVMIWQALNQLNYTARQRGMKITIELRAFGDHIPWHYTDEQGTHEIVLDGRAENIFQIQKILEAVKDGGQKGLFSECGGGNAENSFYQAFTQYQENFKKHQEQDQKTPQLKKTIQQCAIAFTDEDTSPGGLSGLSKELKNLTPEELLKHQLMALNQEYGCPVISLNVKGQENADVNKRRGGYRQSTLMNGTEHLQLAKIMKEVLSSAQLGNTSKNGQNNKSE